MPDVIMNMFIGISNWFITKCKLIFGDYFIIIHGFITIFITFLTTSDFVQYGVEGYLSKKENTFLAWA